MLPQIRKKFLSHTNVNIHNMYKERTRQKEYPGKFSLFEGKEVFRTERNFPQNRG